MLPPGRLATISTTAHRIAPMVFRALRVSPIAPRALLHPPQTIGANSRTHWLVGVGLGAVNLAQDGVGCPPCVPERINSKGGEMGRLGPTCSAVAIMA